MGAPPPPPSLLIHPPPPGNIKEGGPYMKQVPVNIVHILSFCFSFWKKTKQLLIVSFQTANLISYGKL